MHKPKGRTMSHQPGGLFVATEWPSGTGASSSHGLEILSQICAASWHGLSGLVGWWVGHCCLI